MQPIDEQVATEMPERLGGDVPNVSSSRLLGQSWQDNVLSEVVTKYTAIGSRPNRWIANGEFQTIAGYWHKPGHCLAHGNDHELVLQVHLDAGRAMIRLSTDQKHPQFGNGLLATLMPSTIFGNAQEIADRCASLNLVETMWTDIPQLGCWYPVYATGDEARGAFSSFIPNALYGPGIASQTIFWLYQRSRWVIDGAYPTEA